MIVQPLRNKMLRVISVDLQDMGMEEEDSLNGADIILKSLEELGLKECDNDNT